MIRNVRAAGRVLIVILFIVSEPSEGFLWKLVQASYPLEPTSHFLARQLLITNHENCDHANSWGESELDTRG